MLRNSGLRILLCLANYRESFDFCYNILVDGLGDHFHETSLRESRMFHLHSHTRLNSSQTSTNHQSHTQTSNTSLHPFRHPHSITRRHIPRQSPRLHWHPTHPDPPRDSTNRPGHQHQRPPRRRRIQQKRRGSFSWQTRTSSGCSNFVPRSHFADF
jgi:hypothetical protein